MTTLPMPVKAIAPWFGGKRILAKRIVEQLGEHRQFFSPFCGSMAELFAKPPAPFELVNDLHGGVICLARVLADELRVEWLYDRLQRTLICEALLKDAQAYLGATAADPPWWLRNPDAGGEPGPGGQRADENMLEFAYWYFLAVWMGRNGTAGTSRMDYQIACRWTASGGSPSVRWQNAVSSIPAWHQRLKNAQILCRDAFERVLPKIPDDSGVAVYCDPPYMAGTRGFKKNGAGGRYLHEFSHEHGLFGVDDHRRLRDELGRFAKARIVVSYYDCPEVRRLYEGWTIIDHTRHKHLHVQNKRGASRIDAPELLIVNGDAF